MNTSSSTPSRRRPGTINGLQVMFAAILSIGLILAINFSSRISEGQPLQEAYIRVQREIAALQTEQAGLVIQRDYVRSDAYVESWARSDGKMIRPGDVLIVPVPGIAAPPVATPPPLIVQEDETGLPTWALWWSLFFDSPPPEF